MKRSLVVGVIADLSGRPGGGAALRFRDVDLDRLDDVLAALAPEVETGLPFAPRLEPRALGDLHPEALARNVPALAMLLEAREQLDRPEAVRRALGQAGIDPALLGEQAAGGGDLMDDLLSGRSSRRAADPGDDVFARLVREIAEASADRTDYAQQERWRDAIDAELARRLRALLAAPALRALERSWRLLHGLVRQAASAGESVEVRALDLAQSALAETCAGDAPVESSALHRLIVENERGTSGGRPFDLLLADYTFEDRPEDQRVLRHLGEIALRAEAKLLADAGREIWGRVLENGPEAASAEWRALRAAPWARSVGLCAPRTLLRLPYGADADPVDAFPFEEIEGAYERDDALALAGGAGLVVAAALDAWTEGGGLARVADHLLREGLPFFTSRAGGETLGVGPTERVLSEREARRLADGGLVPIAAIRGSDAARIVALQSFAGGRLF